MGLFLDAVDTNRLHISDCKYIPLYPLLASYWDKPLIELPENLRNRVRDAVQSWDEIESRNPPISRGKAIAIKQERVKWFDIKRDYSQEWETYLALQGYIKGGYPIRKYPPGGFVPGQDGYELGILPKRIATARANSEFDIADFLEQKVILPLEGIIREHGLHWPRSEPVLWKALSKFKEMVLARLISEFEAHGNEKFMEELKQAKVYLTRILRLDGSRIYREYPLIEDEWKKNNFINVDSLSESFGSNNKLIGEKLFELDSKLRITPQTHHLKRSQTRHQIQSKVGHRFQSQNRHPLRCKPATILG